MFQVADCFDVFCIDYNSNDSNQRVGGSDKFIGTEMVLVLLLPSIGNKQRYM